MVPQNAQPLQPIKTWTSVNVIKDLTPLTRLFLLLKRGPATLCSDAAPVKIVPDVEDVAGPALQAPPLHLLRDLLLGGVIDAPDEAAVVRRELCRAVVRGLGCRAGVVQEPAPVADDEDVVRPRLQEADVRQGDAVEVGGEVRCRWRLETRPAGGLCSPIWVRSCKEAVGGHHCRHNERSAKEVARSTCHCPQRPTACGTGARLGIHSERGCLVQRHRL
mmetsp:Transcript_113147/g.315005  ORF Transcript_113147/g.315005 Transcript_113147/m.315005 type:complete len:219 (-) Transcript_113147:77-733(-)